MDARQISLVQRVVLRSSGDVLQDALALGDVDGDGTVELVTGSTDGDVRVYRGQEVVAECQGVGAICCVMVDVTLVQGKAVVVVVTTEGWCRLFDFAERDESGSEAPAAAEVPRKVEPFSSVRLPWNVTCALLIDVNSDGKNELLVACHDGGAVSGTLVCALSLLSGAESKASDYLLTWELPGVAVSMSLSQSSDPANRLILIGLQFGGFVSVTLDGIMAQHRLSADSGLRVKSEDIVGQASQRSRGDAGNSSSSDSIGAQEDELLSINKPMFVVGGIDIPQGLHTPPDSPASAELAKNEHSFDTTELSKPQSDFAAADDDETGPPPPSANEDLEALRATSLPGPDPKTQHVALCFGGHLRLERILHDRNTDVLCNEMIWEEYQMRQFFAVLATDVNGDGMQEIISCAWDGLTCVYDLVNNVVRFQFEGRVQGFLAGEYTTAPGRTEMCFFYVTLDNKIVVYTDVRQSIQEIAALTLIDVLRERGVLQHVFTVLEKECDPSVREAIMNELKLLNGGMRRMAFLVKLLHRRLYVD